MPLGNYVILEDGIGERVHLISHTLEVRDVTDSRTLQPTRKNVALFNVDRLNGQPVVAQLSVMAEGLYAKLEPYIPGQAYKNYEFIITKRGIGFTTRYQVDVLPLSAT